MAVVPDLSRLMNDIDKYDKYEYPWQLYTGYKLWLDSLKKEDNRHDNNK